jgi:DNA polymerase-1
VPYWELPKDALLRRNAVDAWATARLYKHYAATLPAEALQYAEEDAQLAMFMARVEERGLWMDEDRMDVLQTEAELHKKEAVERIVKLTMHNINPGSGAQVGGLLEELGCRVGRSPAGNPITDERTLKEMTVPDLRAREVIEAILSYRGAVKLTGTYLKGYAERRDGDGYIRSSFRWPGTVSWRPTSSNPNILNVPRGPFRRVFAAPPGMSVVEGDMGQFQFRAVAVLTQDPEMIAAIREGDPHGRLAGRYFGAGYSKTQRHHAKTCNFLMIFEGGPETLQGEFAKMGDPIDRATARRYWEEFHNLYQRVKPYWNALYASAQGGAPVTCPTGGYYWNYKDALAASNGDSQAALGTIGNAQVQAVETRITLRAGLRLEAAGILPRLDTYDGLICYAKSENSLDAARQMRYTMEAVAQEEPWMAGYPFPAEAKAGASWGELDTVE